MNTTRCTDWQDRLDAYVATHRHVPFDWATHNCATFAAAWVRLATGRDIEVPATADAAAAVEISDALGGLRAAVAGLLGDPVPGLFARAGDLVLVRLPGRPGTVRRQALTVCLGAVCAAPAETGLALVPITEAEAAWRV